MASSLDNILTGILVPTTPVFDVQSLQGTDLNSEEFRQLIVKLTERVNDLSIALNYKEHGIFPLALALRNKFYFPSQTLTAGETEVERQPLGLVINFGALPNTATKSVAHGLTFTANSVLTHLSAYATDPATPSFIPIPYAAVSATPLLDNVEINMDGTNVNIITGKDLTAYTQCIVFIEYLLD